MFKLLGRVVTRFPWVTLALWLIAVVVAVPGAQQVSERLTAENTAPPNSEAAAVTDLVAENFPGNDSQQLILAIDSSGPRVGDPDFEDTVDEALAKIRDVPSVGEITSYRQQGTINLGEAGGRRAAVLIGLNSTELSEAETAADRVRDALSRVEPVEGINFYVTGTGAVARDLTELSDQDVVRAETTALPVTVVVLVLAFGALVAALLPAAVGVVSIAITLGVIFVVADTFTISIFAQSIVTMLGLAASIDYALLMVNRFREELEKGAEPREAAAITTATAGRAVAFSGATVALSMAALLVPPLDIMRSIGIAGILVILVSVAVAVTATPAMLALLGERVNSPRVLRRLVGWTRGEGLWRRLALAVMTRPARYAVAVVALLLALALPALWLVPYDLGVRQIGEEAESRQGVEVLEELGLGGALDSLDVLIDLGEGERFYGSPAVEDVYRLTREIESWRETETALGPTPTDAPLSLIEGLYASEDTARNGPLKDAAELGLSDDGRFVLIRVVPQRAFDPGELDGFVSRIEEAGRDFLPGTTVRVGGDAVQWLEFNRALYGAFPIAVAGVFIATFVLLMLAFRSVLIPLLSIAMNILTVGAAYGLVVLVFQWGFGSELIGIPEGLGAIDPMVPVLIFAVTFGLSMDYQVFLLSRIQENHLGGQGVAQSIAGAIETTGRVITFAALVMLIVFAAFLLGSVTTIQALGFGLGVAVLLDATLVRMVLVPALLRLTGAVNWWLPRWLDRMLPEVRVDK